jgi:cytochrome d ubiquinol oxidase subunit II
MVWIVIGFLGISLLLYCVLGGADFGAGALEFFTRKKHHKRHEELVAKAMGPVWEANHIWLIILIVILFNGFPTVYTEYSIYFHIPLTLMLIGIVFRGCAFTFRHYDAVQDNSHRYYSIAFSISSLLTPIMFGMIIGGMIIGVDPSTTTYYQKYVQPWFNLFSFSIGIFVLSIFSYLASVYLIGETKDTVDQRGYIRRAKITNAILLIAGAVVFLLAETSGHHLFLSFFTNPISVTCFTLATIMTIVFWRKIMQRDISVWNIRFVAGFQVTLVLVAWLAIIFPNVLFYTDGTALSLFEAAAPPATINILAWALLIGSLIFLPVLLYLIRVFKF